MAQQLGREPVRLGQLNPLVDQPESLGGPAGLRQRLCQLTQQDQKIEVVWLDLVNADLQQSPYCFGIVTLEDKNVLKLHAKLAPERQTVLSGVIEQHSCMPLGSGQVTDPQSDGARRQAKGIAQRQCMAGGVRLFNTQFGGVHRLIWQPQQPQYPRKKYERRYPQVRPEANDIPRLIG